MEIRWSPNHEDKFFTFSSDNPQLALYKVHEVSTDGPGQRDKRDYLSDRTYTSTLSFNTDITYKCVAWCPCQTPDHLIAVGHTNGRVQLTNFGKGGTADTNNLLGKEFGPRHQRPCSYLEWNPNDHYWLAEVLERYRQDNSVLIWDVTAAPSYDYSHTTDRKSSASAMDSAYMLRPVVELCMSETVTSLSWFSQTTQTLVVGLGSKHLKIFDMRDSTRPLTTSITKAVFGVGVDRNQENRLASYNENQISIWDKRNFEKPIIPESKPIVKIAWSPIRTGILACLLKDSTDLKLIELHRPSVDGDDLELCFTDRILKPKLYSEPNRAVNGSLAGVRLASFDWHPKHDNRLIVIGSSSALADVTVKERSAICWSPGVYLTWTNSQQLRHYHSVKLCAEASDDVGHKMYRRAQKSYGVTENLTDVIKLQVRGDTCLRRLWKWIKMIRKLQQGLDGSSSDGLSGCEFTYNDGILSVIRSSKGQSEVEQWHWSGISGSSQSSSIKRIFVSRERQHAMRLCGWTMDRKNRQMPLITKLEQDGDFERAAAIAVFSLKLTTAIEILQKASNAANRSASQADLLLTAMAVSGFSGYVPDDKPCVWRDQCRLLSSRLSSPYLRAMFSFLTSSELDSYESLFMEPLELADQVALACLYLPDAKLIDFVNQRTTKCCDEGNLDGIFLTGLSDDGINLLQRYVDKTGDVQTAAVVAVHCVSEAAQLSNAQITSWIVAYQDLLDMWHLWNQRAEFDVFRCRVNRTAPPKPQIVVTCNYCSKSIGFDGSAHSAITRYTGVGVGADTAALPSPAPPSTKPRVSSCAQCRKPLPRCALCLMRLGTTNGPTSSRPKSFSQGQKTTRMADWITWCQTCRHGGHAGHLMDWFRDRKECPVSGCKCCCMSLDSSVSPAVESDLPTNVDKTEAQTSRKDDTDTNLLRSVAVKVTNKA